MPEEFPIPSAESALVIQPSTGLVGLPEGGSPALSEIISRSLAHIQAGSKLSARHQIGEHELCGPDYAFVCAIAEDLRLPPEKVLRLLLLSDELFLDPFGSRDTKIEDGRFKHLSIHKHRLSISSIPSIEGLVVTRFEIYQQNGISGSDFSISPHLTDLYCHGNNLTELDIRNLRNLKYLAYDKETRLHQRPDQNF